MGEPLPLATVHAAILEFLRGRDDAALFGAQAVNAYVDAPRMTEDVDILSSRAPQLAEELRAYLHQRFSMAVRLRTVNDGRGFRVYQLRKPKNRHLADIRSVDVLPPNQQIEDIRVLVPTELIGYKVISLTRRSRSAKGSMDLADLKRLLLAFPDLKREEGAVKAVLVKHGASEPVLTLWQELVGQQLLADEEDEKF